MKAEAAKLQGAGIPAKPCPMERVEWRWPQNNREERLGKLQSKSPKGREILRGAGWRMQGSERFSWCRVGESAVQWAKAKGTIGRSGKVV